MLHKGEVGAEKVNDCGECLEGVFSSSKMPIYNAARWGGAAAGEQMAETFDEDSAERGDKDAKAAPAETTEAFELRAE